MYIYLKELRKANGYTVEKMSQAVGISKSFYSQLENGSRKLSYDMAVKMSKVFGMKPDEIFYDNHLDYKRKLN